MIFTVVVAYLLGTLVALVWRRNGSNWFVAIGVGILVGMPTYALLIARLLGWIKI